jgi:hypothetical protein
VLAGGTNVSLLPIVHADLALETPPTHVVNGMVVWDLAGRPSATQGWYMIPALGVTVQAEGPLARRILATITSSPRAEALAPGSASPIPSSWHTVTFEGLSFAAPRSWSVRRTSEGLGIGNVCATALGVALSQGIVLSTDLHQQFLPCPLELPRPQPPTDGVQIDAGTHLELPSGLAFSTNCLDLHGLTACPAITPAYSILILRVTVPGRTEPLLVSIGLAGNGMTARTILRSLKAA